MKDTIANLVNVTTVRLRVLCSIFRESESSMKRLNIFTIRLYQKLSVTKKAFKQNNVFLSKTSIEEVTDVTQFNSFKKTEKLALKLIYIRTVVTNNTILNLSLMLKQNFIFRNKARGISGNDKLKNLRLSSQRHCTFIWVLQKVFTKKRDSILQYKCEICRALQRKPVPVAARSKA